MKITSVIVWITIIASVGFLYTQWYTNYNSSVKAWEPIVAECSKHGGFMDAKGTCDYNQ